jgi:hypothetical protein
MEKQPKNLGYFCHFFHFLRLPKVTNYPIGENSLNLVTLLRSCVVNRARLHSLRIDEAFKEFSLFVIYHAALDG